MELLQEAEFWVFVGLLIFAGILVFVKVPGVAMRALDARALGIRADLDEAQRLRREAEALLASIKTQREDAQRQAAEIVANAEAEAKRLEVEARVRLDEQIQRRAELAHRKIANAEAQATAQVKGAAAEMAAQAAETILAGRLAKAKSDPLVDRATGQIAAKLQ